MNDLTVSCKLPGSDFVAGDVIEVDIGITNSASGQIAVLAGETWGRPAYFRFSARLQPSGQDLRDPYPNAGIEPQGPATTVQLDPGQTTTGSIILNQFVALEDARDMLTPGQTAVLGIRWSAHLQAGRKASKHFRAAEPVSGEIQARLTRDDDRLRKSIESLAAKLMNDWAAISFDPVGRRHAILALASLRVPEAASYLVSLTSFPEFEVARWAQYALSELQNEPKK